MCQYVECLLLSLFFLCHLLNVGTCICHIAREGQVEWTTQRRRSEENEFRFHNVTCYTNYIVSLIHFNATKLCNITYTLVATCVRIRSLECTKIWDQGRKIEVASFPCKNLVILIQENNHLNLTTQSSSLDPIMTFKVRSIKGW